MNNICYNNIKVRYDKTVYEFDIIISAFLDKCFNVSFNNDVDYTFDKIVRNMNGQYPDVIDIHIDDERDHTYAINGLLKEFGLTKRQDLLIFMIVCFVGFTELLNDERFTSCLPFMPSCMFECTEDYFNYNVLEYYKTYSSICLSLISMDERHADEYKSVLYVINLFTTYFSSMFHKSTCITCDIDISNLMCVFANKFVVMNRSLDMMKDENCRLAEQVSCLEDEIREIYTILKSMRSRK